MLGISDRNVLCVFKVYELCDVTWHHFGTDVGKYFLTAWKAMRFSFRKDIVSIPYFPTWTFVMLWKCGIFKWNLDPFNGGSELDFQLFRFTTENPKEQCKGRNQQQSPEYCRKISNFLYIRTRILLNNFKKHGMAPTSFSLRGLTQLDG